MTRTAAFFFLSFGLSAMVACTPAERNFGNTGGSGGTGGAGTTSSSSTTSGTGGAGGGTGGSTSGTGGSMCMPGYLDCDNDASCETDPASDPQNCGACGHSCLGGDCVSGTCQPFPIAMGIAAPQAIAVFQTELFIGTGNGEVLHLPTSGGGMIMPLFQVNGPVASIAVTSLGVFVTDGTRVSAISPTGNLMWNSAGTNGIDNVAANDQFVAWTSTNKGEVRSSGAMGGSNKTISLGEQGPTSVVLQGTDVFWTNLFSSEIRMGSTLGAPPTTVFANTPNPDHLIGDATALYWLGGDTIYSAAPGGMPTPLGSTGSDMRALVLDATRLYWTLANQGEVWSMPKDGSSAPEMLAKGQALPFGIAVDPDAIYWANTQDGTIMKLAK